MDKNRELHELLGLCWHEIKEVTPTMRYKCSCGYICYVDDSMNYHCRVNNPDYAADPRLVLREMEKRDDFNRFVAKINGFSLDEDDELIDNAIPIDLILDTTGKVGDLAIKWLEGKK